MPPITVLARLVTLILTACWGPGVLGERIELNQALVFKWQGVTVATVQFDVSIPVTGIPDHMGESGFSPSRIKIIGETKGPLGWIQDYQATVDYSRSQDTGRESVFALQGLDGGEPEQRRITFVPGQLPRVETFKDSTASAPLALKEEWLGKAENPLSALEGILRAAVLGQTCANNMWGFDGKRRYRLEARDVAFAGTRTHAAIAEPGSPITAAPENLEQYQCTLTLYAQGRETVGRSEEPKFTGWRGRLASLWPFSDSDRELFFYFNVIRSEGGETYQVTFNKIVIPAGIGSIVGQSR